MEEREGKKEKILILSFFLYLEEGKGRIRDFMQRKGKKKKGGGGAPLTFPYYFVCTDGTRKRGRSR